ncbi:hypothetical protein BLW95_10245 [Lacticaseibacillus paracasei]|nr:hypothetical protein BLW95_10245 [Lacticaseibacillus paracasei]
MFFLVWLEDVFFVELEDGFYYQKLEEEVVRRFVREVEFRFVSFFVSVRMMKIFEAEGGREVVIRFVFFYYKAGGYLSSGWSSARGCSRVV